MVFENINITLLLAILALCVNGLSFLFILRVKQHFLQAEKVHKKQIQMVNTGAHGMGARVIELEHRIDSMRRTQKDLSETQSDYSYTKAKQLLENGLSPSAVATSCGLSLSEVELMLLLRQGGQTEAYAFEAPSFEAL